MAPLAAKLGTFVDGDHVLFFPKDKSDSMMNEVAIEFECGGLTEIATANRIRVRRQTNEASRWRCVFGRALCTTG